MKNMVLKCVPVFAVLAMAMPVHALDETLETGESARASGFSTNISMLGLSIGGVIPIASESGHASVEGSFVALGFGAEHNGTNLGLMFNPFTVWTHLGNYPLGNNSEHFSLLNLTLYWNVLSRTVFNTVIRGENPTEWAAASIRMFAGPFVSANYFFFDIIARRFILDGHIFTAGLRAGLGIEVENVNLELFSVVAGFRLLNGRNHVFVGTAIDVLPLLGLVRL